MTGRPPQDFPPLQGAALRPGSFQIGAACLALSLLAGCNPTVKVEAPDKPIEINMNVNIEHRVKVEIDRDVQQAMKNNKEIF